MSVHGRATYAVEDRAHTPPPPYRPKTPPGWTSHQDEDGCRYYYNVTTRQSQYQFPTATWTSHVDQNGKTYYYNMDTGQLLYNAPETTKHPLNTSIAPTDTQTVIPDTDKVYHTLTTMTTPSAIANPPRRPRRSSSCNSIPISQTTSNNAGTRQPQAGFPPWTRQFQDQGPVRSKDSLENLYRRHDTAADNKFDDAPQRAHMPATARKVLTTDANPTTSCTHWQCAFHSRNRSIGHPPSLNVSYRGEPHKRPRGMARRPLSPKRCDNPRCICHEGHPAYVRCSKVKPLPDVDQRYSRRRSQSPDGPRAFASFSGGREQDYEARTMQ